MDFLDPQKQRQHAILLYVGYALIGIAIIISTIVLVYQANGYGVNSKGQVVQSGLLFFSSQPNPADIYMNGAKNQAQTNTRMSVAAGQYKVELKRAGYRTWQRPITVQGGDVQHFDYPFLFPDKLTTKNQAAYQSGSGVASQSRDKRWLLVQQIPNGLTFDLHDLKNPDSLQTTELTLPATLVHTPAGDQSWEAITWAGDNVHALFKHTYTGGVEYILVNREEVAKSVNLNATLGVSPAELTFIDNKYDKYNVLNAAGELSTASLSDPQPVKILDNVLEYKSYGTKTILYATTTGAAAGKAHVSLFDGEKSAVIREVAANTTYVLDMAGYGGTPFVVLGAASENMVYVYRDPIAQLKDDSVKTPAAIRALRIISPSYVAFSPNTQYIAAESASGTQLGVYDVYLKHAYIYILPAPFDAPQQHGSWMDGNRFNYVSNSKVFVFDYDRRNQQTLMAASPSYLPFYSPDYHHVYTITSAAAGGTALTQTPLLTEADL